MKVKLYTFFKTLINWWEEKVKNAKHSQNIIFIWNSMFVLQIKPLATEWKVSVIIVKFTKQHKWKHNKWKNAWNFKWITSKIVLWSPDRTFRTKIFCVRTVALSSPTPEKEEWLRQITRLQFKHTIWWPLFYNNATNRLLFNLKFQTDNEWYNCQNTNT